MTDKSRTNGRGDFAAEVEGRAKAIAEGWQRKEDDDRMARARSIAQRQVRNERQQTVDSKPETWEQRFANARLQGLCAVWPRCPADLSSCVRPGSGFSIDPSGIWFVDGDSSVRSFVASPMVALPGFRYAFMAKGGDWQTIEVRAQGRGDDGHYARQVVEALAKAGATFGSGVVLPGVNADDPAETYPVGDWVALWLFSSWRGAHVAGPVVSLTAARDELADATRMSVEDKARSAARPASTVTVNARRPRSVDGPR